MACNRKNISNKLLSAATATATQHGCIFIETGIKLRYFKKTAKGALLDVKCCLQKDCRALAQLLMA